MKGNNLLVQRETNDDSKYGIPAMREFVQLYGYENISYHDSKKKIDVAYKDNEGGLLKDVFDLCYQNSNLIKDTPLSKTTRYYVSNNGIQLIKKMPFLKSKLNKYHNTSMRLFDTKDLSNTQKQKLYSLDIKLPERETNIESGWLCTIMNKVVEKEDYNIDYNYYISETYKIINIYINESRG